MVLLSSLYEQVCLSTKKRIFSASLDTYRQSNYIFGILSSRRVEWCYFQASTSKFACRQKNVFSRLPLILIDKVIIFSESSLQDASNGATFKPLRASLLVDKKTYFLGFP